MKGLTGPIQFKGGQRTDFKLDLMKLKQHTLAKVGEWTPGLGVNITDMSAFHDTAPYNITLVVVTIVVNIHFYVLNASQSNGFINIHVHCLYI